MSTKKPKAADMQLPLYESIFGEGKQRTGMPVKLVIDDLHPFPKQPFRLYTEEKMREMVESVTEFGVISPIIVRPNPNGEGYEIISGHNRVEACRRANINQVPAIIREIDDDTAIILMVDSNLRQREKLLPSEKAKAYKMKMDALKRQGERRDLTCDHDGHKLQGSKTRIVVGAEAGDSGTQVQRFMRLASLSALSSRKTTPRLKTPPSCESITAPTGRDSIWTDGSTPCGMTGRAFGSPWGTPCRAAWS